MRLSPRPAALATVVLLAGCTEKEADTQSKAAGAVIAGLLAVADIFANAETDADATKDALLAFASTPVGASALLEVPVDLPRPAGGGTAGLRREALSFPSCMTVTDVDGEACNEIRTDETEGCDAGDFHLEGSGNRRCNPCDDATAECEYDWDFDVSYASDEFSFDLDTRAEDVAIGPDRLAASTSFDLNMWNEDGTLADVTVKICTCGPVDIDNSCETDVVAGTFLVINEGVDESAYDGLLACIRIDVTACGENTVDDACTCPGGATAVCP